MNVDLGVLQVAGHLRARDRHALDARVAQLEQDGLAGHLAHNFSNTGESVRLHFRGP
jgi:hypothetical protein